MKVISIIFINFFILFSPISVIYKYYVIAWFGFCWVVVMGCIFVNWSWGKSVRLSYIYLYWHGHICSGIFSKIYYAGRNHLFILSNLKNKTKQSLSEKVWRHKHQKKEEAAEFWSTRERGKGEEFESNVDEGQKLRSYREGF